MNGKETLGESKELDSCIAEGPGVIQDLEVIVQSLMISQGSDPAELKQTTKSVNRGQQKIIKNIFKQVDLVAQQTEWTQPKLLERMDIKQAPATGFSELGDERLEDCAHFLGLLAREVNLDSIIPKKREAVTMLARLVVHTDLTAKALDQLLDSKISPRTAAQLRKISPDTSVQLNHSDGFSPRQYMRLGEIGQAARFARIMVDAYRPEDLSLTILPSYGHPAHISTPSLDAYVRGQREAFGDDVFDAIDEHVHVCRHCSAAASHRHRL